MDIFQATREGPWWLKVGRAKQIHTRVLFADYLQMPGLSISRLKEMKRSGQHCEYFARNPKRSDALTLGSAAHCRTLEPDRFAGAYRIWDRRTESGRRAPRNGHEWEKFQAEAFAAGCEILTEDDAASAEAIATAVRSSAPAMKYLTAGEPEIVMQWQMQGRACRGRIDWLTSVGDCPVLVGLKTTRDCRIEKFGRQAADLEYPQQWAWYFNGYSIITGVKPKVIEIVVESKAPHAVAVYEIPDEVILKGEEEFGKSLQAFGECERTGRWPGPVPRETELLLPNWYYGDAHVDDLAETGLIFGGDEVEEAA